MNISGSMISSQRSGTETKSFQIVFKMRIAHYLIIITFISYANIFTISQPKYIAIGPRQSHIIDIITPD